MSVISREHYKDLIIIPTYNERDTISMLVHEISVLYPEMYVLVVDDNSPDGTQAVVKNLMNVHKHIQLLSREKKTGLGDAYKNAFLHILQDEAIRYIITMDADGSHRPESIKDLIAAMKTHDFAIGSRYMKGERSRIISWPVLRRLLSRYGNRYTRVLAGMPIRDLTSGFICIKRSVVDESIFSRISSTGYAYQIEFKFNILRHARAKHVEVPILFHPRRAGESKITPHIIAEGIVTPLRLFIQRLFT